MSEMAEKPESGRAEQAANLFDLRRIIGFLFVAWGILLTVLGLTESDAEIAKAADVNINLLAGLGMLVFGLLFLLWAFTRPLGEVLREAETGEHQASPRAAAPHGVDAAALASEESRRRARGHSQGGRRPRDPGGQ
jgi:Na+-transporting methylmalonyl-CoA/oxaloacetate decarboxylase gamma subunit